MAGAITPAPKDVLNTSATVPLHIYCSTYIRECGLLPMVMYRPVTSATYASDVHVQGARKK